MKPNLPNLIINDNVTDRPTTAWLGPIRTSHIACIQWLRDLPNNELAPPTPCGTMDTAEASKSSRKRRVLPRPSDSEIGSLVAVAPQRLAAQRTNEIVPPPLLSSTSYLSMGYEAMSSEHEHSGSEELDMALLSSPKTYLKLSK